MSAGTKKNHEKALSEAKTMKQWCHTWYSLVLHKCLVQGIPHTKHLYGIYRTEYIKADL